MVMGDGDGCEGLGLESLCVNGPACREGLRGPHWVISN